MIISETITLIGTILVLAELAGVILALDAVMRPRSSQGTIAWMIALVSLPVITIPLYLLFGRTRFQGYAEAIREKEVRIGTLWSQWYAWINDLAAKPRMNIKAIDSVVRRLTHVPFTRGNRVTLLLDGAETYNAMIAAIDGAKAYIYVQFFIVRDDVSGRRFRDALIDRAHAGVRVHFLYDEIGSLKLDRAYLEAMLQAGIEVSGFKTTQGRKNRLQINFRNHRKLLIIDGSTGFIGGHNLGDEYLGYRDTHMRIDGPAAQQIQHTFLKDWFWATEQVPESNLTADPLPASDQAVAIVNTGPADQQNSCSILFTSLINLARKRLWITSPYFVPDDALVRALQAAALRGVDVRILLPGKADHKFVELASFTYYPDMTSCGVRMFRYQPRFMHQKVILVDDKLAGIGTVNLDNRAIYLNFEATGLVADKVFVQQVTEMLENDLNECIEVDCSLFEAKPLWFHIAARLARLASPLL